MKKCGQCDTEFETTDALIMHIKAKHPEEKLPFVFPKKAIKWIIALVIIALLVYGIYSLATRNTTSTEKLNVTISPDELKNIPFGPTHWHPVLRIKINGNYAEIPAGIGINIGKVTDLDIAGDMGMTPTHTHSADGVVHLENRNPSKKPETFTLGYFFYIWDKQFNENCIFDYCTDKGTLKMLVNGKDNNEFQNYVMKDGDLIEIEYESNEKK